MILSRDCFISSNDWFIDPVNIVELIFSLMFYCLSAFYGPANPLVLFKKVGIYFHCECFGGCGCTYTKVG